jgi:predicted nuclease of predicted toxin-antitoxin system
MRLLIDMNLSPKWVGFLADHGFEAVHWSAVGLANASDPELMAFATAGNYVILTHDLDFGAILAATGGAGPSVVQIRAEDLAIEAIGAEIVTALRQAEDALASGALVTVDPKRARITLLPIHP